MVLSALNCDTTYGLPYECKSTSKAERTNKRLNQSLRLILHDKNPLYARYLCSRDALGLKAGQARRATIGYLVYKRILSHRTNTLVTSACSALNLIKSRAMGHSANLLVYGRELNTPVSLLVTNEDKNQESHETYDVKAYQLHKTYKQIIHKVRKHLNSEYKQ